MRWLAFLIALLLAAPAFADPQKPLVRDVTTGQTREIPTTGTLLLPAPTTNNASIRLPHGTAPDSGHIQNGDCWTTITALYCRINGTTVAYGTATPPGGTSGQIQYNNAGAFGGFTASGDATINTATGAVAVAKIAGVSPGYFYSGTDAANLTGTVACPRLPALTGDVTTSGCAATGVQAAKWTTARVLSFTGDVTGSGSVDGSAAVATALTIGSNKVTVGMQAQAPANTMLGNWTGSTANIVANAIMSCFGSANALIFTPGTGVGCHDPVPATSANPFAIGSASIGSGDGVTGLNCSSITSLSEGSLCMRTDVSALYRMWLPPTAVPTRVNEAASANTYVVTMPTVVPGNYLVAMCYRSSALPAANTGWFSKATHNQSGASDPYVRVVTKLIAVGETTTQTPCTGTANSYGADIVQVSGLDMVNFNNSLQATSFGVANNAGGGSLSVTLTSTTTTTNVLALSFAAADSQNNSALGTPPNITRNSGWTNAVNGNSGSVAWMNVNSAASQFFGSNGSTVTATTTRAVFFAVADGMTATLVLLQAPTGPNVGMQMMSDLTTIYSGGVQITPSGTSARSLNFSTGLTCTDDGNGAETCTSTPTFTGDCTNAAFVLTCALPATNITSGNLAAARMSGNLSAAIDSAFTCSAQGSILTRGASNWSCLGPSTVGWSLTTNGAGADAAWANVGGGGGGGVTQVNTASPWTSGGPITTTGTITGGPLVKATTAAAIMSMFGGL